MRWKETETITSGSSNHKNMFIQNHLEIEKKQSKGRCEREIKREKEGVKQKRMTIS